MKIKAVITKTVAAVLAVATILCFSSCKDTSWTFKSGKETMNSGVYLGMMVDAYYSAMYMVQDQNKDLFDQKIDKVPAADYIKAEAEKSAKRYFAVENLFKKYKLEFTDKEMDKFNEEVNNMWSNVSAIYEENGCGKESFKKIMLTEEKHNKIFKYYYGENGVEPVSEKDRKDYFNKNFAKMKRVGISYASHFKGVQTEASASDNQKKELKELAEKYLERLKKGEDIDKLIAEEKAIMEGSKDVSKVKVEKVEPTFVERDKSKEPDKFNKELFKSEYNKPILYKNETEGYFVYIRLNMDANSKDYTDREDSVLNSMKHEDFHKVLDKEIKNIKLTKNSASVKRFKPQNVEIKMG